MEGIIMDNQKNGQDLNNLLNDLPKSNLDGIEIINPIISGMDMLSLDYTQPTAQSQTFKIEFKYSNIDYQFIENDKDDNVIKTIS